MGWVGCSLLDLCAVVDCVLVEGELSDLGEWELLLWPDVRQVEDVDLLLLSELLGLPGCHGLNLDRPFGEVAICKRCPDTIAQ